MKAMPLVKNQTIVYEQSVNALPCLQAKGELSNFVNV